MSVTATRLPALRSSRAAYSPAKPPPTITTRWGPPLRGVAASESGVSPWAGAPAVVMPPSYARPPAAPARDLPVSARQFLWNVDDLRREDPAIVAERVDRERVLHPGSETADVDAAAARRPHRLHHAVERERATRQVPGRDREGANRDAVAADPGEVVRHARGGARRRLRPEVALVEADPRPAEVGLELAGRPAGQLVEAHHRVQERARRLLRVRRQPRAHLEHRRGDGRQRHVERLHAAPG